MAQELWLDVERVFDSEGYARATLTKQIGVHIKGGKITDCCYPLKYTFIDGELVDWAGNEYVLKSQGYVRLRKALNEA